MQKQVIFKTKGMQRDLSASAFNSGYSYENKNVRVMPTDESTLLSLINEKGNKKSGIAGVGDHIKGIPIGQALVNNELIIFAAGDDDYRIRKPRRGYPEYPAADGSDAVYPRLERI